MAQYIDKDALVAEIERRLRELSQLEKASYEIGLYDAYKIVLYFLDTLEVKDVDLENEFGNYTKNILACDVQFEPFTHLYNCAKHFFELGMRVNSPITAADRGMAEEINKRR